MIVYNFYNENFLQTFFLDVGRRRKHQINAGEKNDWLLQSKRVSISANPLYLLTH
jgi:hypothetical protein